MYGGVTDVCVAAIGRGGADFWKRLGASQDGLALIEFGMSLPVLLLLGLAGLETANYSLAHLRVSSIAAMAADNASRVRESIDESDVNDLMVGATMSGDTIAFQANGRVILSVIEPSPDNMRQWIRWQRCSGALTDQSEHGRPLTAAGTIIKNGTEVYQTDRVSASTNPSAQNRSTLVGVRAGDAVIAAQPGSAVMVAEAVYRYRPLVPGSYLTDREIRYTSAYNVRQRVDQTLRNAGRMTPLSCG